MKIRTFLLAFLGIIFLALILINHGDRKMIPVDSIVGTASPQIARTSSINPPPVKPIPENIPIMPPTAESQPQIKSVGTPAPKAQNQPSMSGGPTRIPKVKEPIQDPDARAALSLVGISPEAEQYWVDAINDPRLGADERKDLIEDLNEDGLSDPKHPGPEDVPLIMNRLELIEELAPFAMDQVNADAFAEAYKDLADMLAGKPVQ